MKDKICRTFKHISGKVWNLLDDSGYYGLYKTSASNISRGLGLGEETITDLALLEISKRQPLDIITVKFGKYREAQEGADWEWWFLSQSGIIGMRIQAKRIHFVNGEYEYTYLDYKRSENEYQVDVLLENAQKRRVVPLYAFYNYWDIDFPFKNYLNPVLTSLKCCKVESPKKLGITIVSAFDIRILVCHTDFDNSIKFESNLNTRAKKSIGPKKKLSDVLPRSFPIHCLTCCSSSDLKKSVSRFLNKYVVKSDSEVVVHEKLPEDVYLRLKGEFDQSTPTFTTFILDLDHPHEEAHMIEKSIIPKNYQKREKRE